MQIIVPWRTRGPRSLTVSNTWFRHPDTSRARPWARALGPGLTGTPKRIAQGARALGQGLTGTPKRIAQRAQGPTWRPSMGRLRGPRAHWAPVQRSPKGPGAQGARGAPVQRPPKGPRAQRGFWGPQGTPGGPKGTLGSPWGHLGPLGPLLGGAREGSLHWFVRSLAEAD